MPMTEGDVLRRLTSISLIAGGVLTVAGSQLAFRFDEAAVAFTGLADGWWPGAGGVAASLTGAMAFWTLVGGFSNVHHFLREGAAAAWSRLGWYGLVAGSAGLTVAYGLAISAVQSTALEDDAGAAMAAGLYLASRAVYDLSAIGFWSSLAVVAIGMTRNRVYPGWSSRSLLVIAPVAAGFGAARLTAGLSTPDALQLALLTGPTAVWAVATGVWLVREGWQPEGRVAQTASRQERGQPV